MSLKFELTKWQEAVEAYERADFAHSIKTFLEITAIGAKIYFNMGMVYFALGRHEDSAISFANAIHKDPYFAVAHFQRGVSKWILHDYETALESFTETIEFLRDNSCIDYRQLGLRYRLYSFETFFNRALCFLANGDVENAILDLNDAHKDAVLPEHYLDRYQVDMVLGAYREGRIDDYLPFVVPVGRMYRPPQLKIKTTKKPLEFIGATKGQVIVDVTSDESKVDTNARSQTPEQRVSNQPMLNKKRPMSEQIFSQKYPFPSDVTGRRPSNDEQHIQSNFERKVSDASVRTINSDTLAQNRITGKLRVKCHFENEVRVLLVPCVISYDELLCKIRQKFALETSKIKYLDEDGDYVLMTDQEDLEMSFDQNAEFPRLNLVVER